MTASGLASVIKYKRMTSVDGNRGLVIFYTNVPCQLSFWQIGNIPPTTLFTDAHFMTND